MNYLFLTLILLISVFHTRAQDTTNISLEKLMQQIESNYPSIIQFQYKIQSLQATADGTNAWMPPTFSTGLM